MIKKQITHKELEALLKLTQMGKGSNLEQLQIQVADLCQKSEYLIFPDQNDGHHFYEKDIQFSALNNHIVDFFELLEKLPADSTLIDIGSAHGILSITASLFFKNKFTIHSIEAVKGRLNFARTLSHFQKENHHFYESLFSQDIFQTILSNINRCEKVYLLLYIPTGKLLEEIISLNLTPIQKINALVIESHGDLISRINLSSKFSFQQVKTKLKTPRHDCNCYEYLLNPLAKQSLIDERLELINRDDMYFLIPDKDKHWLAITKNLDYQILNSDEIFVFFPCNQRSIKMKINEFEGIKSINKESLPPKLVPLISTQENDYQKLGINSKIRKIYFEDGSLEIAP